MKGELVMNFKRIQTLGVLSPVHVINMDCLQLIDCGDNIHFYVNDFVEENSLPFKVNFAPYYELVGTIISKETDSDYIDYKVVTRSIFLFSKPVDAAIGMPSVHIPATWQEWLGYFTGKEWILVEFPRSSKDDGDDEEDDSDYWMNPRILRQSEKIPHPSSGVSSVHFAEDEKGNLFIVQAYDYNGLPIPVEELDEINWYPVKILPRKKLEHKKGKMYAYSGPCWYVVI
jgi:hypothetical protein